jgi:hypothetical protein
VQPDVLGLGEQVDQRGERVARCGGDEVVVVDEQEDLRPGPPAAGPQLLGGDVGAGQPPAQRRDQVGHRRGQRLGRRRVADEVLRVDRPEQPPPVVDDHQPGLLRGVAGDHLVGEQAQQGGLAGLAVGVDDEVRVGGDVEQDRGEAVLVDPDRQQVPLAGPRARQVGDVDPLGQQPHRRHGGAVPGRRHRGDAVVVAAAGDRDEHVVSVGRQPPPGPARRDRGRHPPVDLRLPGVAQAQLHPRAEQVLERGTQLGPAAHRDRDVHAVGQARRRQRDDRRLQRLVVGPERVPAVDDEHDVTEAVVPGRRFAAATPGPQVGRRGEAVLAEPALPGAQRRRDLGHHAAHQVGVAASGDGAHVR